MWESCFFQNASRKSFNKKLACTRLNTMAVVGQMLREENYVKNVDKSIGKIQYMESSEHCRLVGETGPLLGIPGITGPVLAFIGQREAWAAIRIWAVVCSSKYSMAVDGNFEWHFLDAMAHFTFLALDANVIECLQNFC
jgi:hypothetical protein